MGGHRLRFGENLEEHLNLSKPPLSAKKATVAASPKILQLEL